MFTILSILLGMLGLLADFLTTSFSVVLFDRSVGVRLRLTPTYRMEAIFTEFSFSLTQTQLKPLDVKFSSIL